MSTTVPLSQPKQPRGRPAGKGDGEVKKKKKKSSFSVITYIPKVAKKIRNGTSTTPELGAATNGILIQCIIPRVVKQIGHFRDVSGRKRIGIAQVKGGFAAIMSDKRFKKLDAYAMEKVKLFEESQAAEKLKAAAAKEAAGIDSKKKKGGKMIEAEVQQEEEDDIEE